MRCYYKTSTYNHTVHLLYIYRIYLPLPGYRLSTIVQHFHTDLHYSIYMLVHDTIYIYRLVYTVPKNDHNLKIKTEPVMSRAYATVNIQFCSHMYSVVLHTVHVYLVLPKNQAMYRCICSSHYRLGFGAEIQIIFGTV